MRQKRSVPFKITTVDSLGQGVSKETDKITFIPKTLPNETGTAEIMAEKKGVAFARPSSIEQKSPLRVQAPCPHFEVCPSCHFQHTTYEQELQFKEQAMEKLFFKVPHPKIQVVGAPYRYEYRNRVQLHYDLKLKKLGMFDAQTQTIIPIPGCIITLPEVKKELLRLYENEQWIKEAQGRPLSGHVEIYQADDQVKINWNKAYAEGGFTQVFEAMNLKLKEMLINKWQDHKSETLDLFAGNGNLSDKLNAPRRFCVDIYPHHGLKGEFLSQNLYADESLKVVTKELRKNSFKVDHLLLDPPRSGLKNLKDWVGEFKPRFITYVSCDPHTLARDMATIQGYNIQELVLLDFFPATFHFESLIFLERQS